MQYSYSIIISAVFIFCIYNFSRIVCIEYTYDDSMYYFRLISIIRIIRMWILSALLLYYISYISFSNVLYYLKVKQLIAKKFKKYEIFLILRLRQYIIFSAPQTYIYHHVLCAAIKKGQQQSHRTVL